jgi:hypothetical protein
MNENLKEATHSKDRGNNAPVDPHAIAVQVRLRKTREHGDEKRVTIRVGKQATLLDLMQDGAERLGVEILPSPTNPFDTLHQTKSGSDDIGPAISDLDSTIQEFLREPGAAPDFIILLELVFRVNTRWAISPSTEQTPRQILTLPKIELSPEEYSLYNSDSSDVLPPDQPVRICHGTVFEAQKDGKYGNFR